MTAKEIRTEIQKMLDSFPEAALNDLLEYLKTIQSKPGDQVELSNNLRKILSEDNELLKKLAQ